MNATDIRDFLRNIKGRYDLFALLFKWDKPYRKEIIITMLAFILITYSLIDMDSGYDYIALAIEVGIIMLQFGSEMSILPQSHRPTHGGSKYVPEICTYIWHNKRSVPISNILPALKEEKIGFTNPIKGRNLSIESPLVSNQVDDKVCLVNKLRYKEEYGIINYIRSNLQILYIALRVGNKATHTVNGEKLALSSLVDAIVKDKAVTVRKSYYFDALMTAEAFRSRLLRTNLRGQEEIYADLSSYFPVVQDLTSSFAGSQNKNTDIKVRFAQKFYEQVSGHIGITSLVMTENNRIAMMYQGEKKAIDAKKVSLGGSGSMDYDDMIDTNRPKDLREAVAYGMAREVSEETNMKRFFNVIKDNTRVIGFFRWVDRCGKPEFVGITKSGSINFFKDGNIDGDEITKFEEMPVEIKTIKSFKKALKYVEDNNIRISLSSLMALHRLTVIADYNKKDATSEQKQIYKELSDFLFKS